MTDTTGRRVRPDRAKANERMRRYRLRKAGVLPPLPPLPPCPQCGALVRSTGPICRRCWRLTDDGRTWNRARMRRARAETS